MDAAVPDRVPVKWQPVLWAGTLGPLCSRRSQRQRAGEGVIDKGEIRVEQTAPRVVIRASVGCLKTFAGVVGSGIKVKWISMRTISHSAIICGSSVSWTVWSMCGDILCTSSMTRICRLIMPLANPHSSQLSATYGLGN
jgi:hypothetical protein